MIKNIFDNHLLIFYYIKTLFYLKFDKIMKLKLLICATVATFALFSAPIFSQDEEFEDYQFDDYEANEQKTPYFALSLGGNFSFLFMDYAAINSKQIAADFLNIDSEDFTWKEIYGEEFSGPMLTYGFNFFTAMSPLVNNARIGITYQRGSKKLEQQVDNFPTVDIAEGEIALRKVNLYRNLSIQALGFHLDYAFVPFKSLAILAGAGFKWGTMTLEQFATNASENLVPDWNANYTVINFFNQQLKYKYISIEPQISVEYALTGFLMLKAGASYLLSMDNPFYENAWTINGNNAYKGAPSSVKPQGFSVNLGLYLGLFNY